MGVLYLQCIAMFLTVLPVPVNHEPRDYALACTEVRIRSRLPICHIHTPTHALPSRADTVGFPCILLSNS